VDDNGYSDDVSIPGYQYNFTLYLYDSNGDVVAQTTTDQWGNFDIPGLAPGNYSLVLAYDSNLYKQSPSNSDYGGNSFAAGTYGYGIDTLTVPLNGNIGGFGGIQGGIAPINNGFVSGSVFNDYNGNGLNDDGYGNWSDVEMDLRAYALQSA